MTELLRERYEPVEVVGHGGEGRVLKAIDHQLDRLVALKVRAALDRTDREALLTEARVLLGIPPHPNLALVREDFFEGDQYVIAMDWIDGIDLSRLVRARGRPGLAAASVLRWLADAASALTHLHTLDPPVVHGDVKPANLVLTSGGRVVLVDLGLSSLPNGRHRRGGTPGYAAPELAAGEAPSRASDVYSLAATAFALLTGEPPMGLRPPWDGIDASQATLLENAIRAGLATDPARRPSTAGEFVERLRAGWASTLPTGVLTFCLTDIEGSTALWESHPAAMARALVRHDELLAEAVERRGGRFLKSMGEGDASVSVFPAPKAALDAMIDVQRHLARRANDDDIGLRIRAAVHTGEAERRGGDYSGATLNLAARLRSLADGGQVFVSQATADLVRETLPADAQLVDLGPHRLRGAGEREPVYALSAPGVDAPPPVTSSPYPGLPAFEVADADRFFGREAVVADVAHHVATAGFVAIVGASGSGKSSVLRAGLAARVGGAVVITPGSAPSPLPEGDELIVVDQLEEAFSLCDDPDVRTAFLASVARRRGPVAVGIRADFYGRCAEHPRLAAAMAGDQVLLGPLSPEELHEAITGPAEALGLRVEPALVDILVGEVIGEPGALPLLSHALRATWERRDGRTLTVEAYRRTGGLRAAIATTAEEVYDRLDVGARDLSRRTFLALTEPGDGTADSRRWATRAELTPPGAAERVDSLLEAMATARLVSMADGKVAVAHEALIREWPRLRTWLDEDREGLLLHRHLAGAAAAWDSLGREPSELYRGPRLAAAVEWADRTEDLSSLEADFLAASRAEREQGERARARGTRRLRALLAGVGIALVVALGAAAWAVNQQREAADARDQADVARIAAVSRSVVENQADLGLLLAATAYDLDDTADTRSTLLSALETHPLLAGLIYGVDSGLEAAAFTPDGSILATPTSDGTGTILWDTATRRRVAALTHEDDFSLDAAISPDGQTLAVPAIYVTDDGLPAGRLEVWDLATRSLTTVVPSPAGTLTTAAFTPDGSRLVTQGGPSGTTAPSDVAVVWDTGTWEPVGDPWALGPRYSGDSTLVLSPDGSFVALPRPDGASVRVWRLTDRAPVGDPIDVATVAGGDEGPVVGVAFTPDGDTLAMATEGGAIVFADVATGSRAEETLRLSESVATALDYSRDGSMLVVGRLDGRTQLYDVATAEPLGPALAASASAITDASFSPDGSALATTSTDRTGAIWRLDGSRSIGTVLEGQESPITEARYTDDGTTLLTAAVDGSVAVRRADTGEIIDSVRLPGEVLSVAVAAGGDRVAAGGTGGTVSLFDLDGRHRVDLPVGRAWAHQVAFSPDGRTVAIALDQSGNDPAASGPGTGQVLSVDAATGEPVGDAIEMDEPAIGGGFSPDGQLLVAIAANNVLHVYDAGSRAELEPAIENVDALITSFAFSPDGDRLSVGVASGDVRQYDVTSHQAVGDALTGGSGQVFGVAYSPDGGMVAGSSLGLSTTNLWDTASGSPIGGLLTGGRVPYTFRTFYAGHFLGARPAFSPHGQRLVTPGFEGATVMWELDPDEWLGAACAMAGRDLTEDEWQRYLPDRDPEPLCRRR